MTKTPRDRTLALAGLFQAVRLVQQIAREGSTAPQPFEATIRSVLTTDAATTDDVYGGIDGIRMGLEILSTLLSRSNKERDMEITRYALAVLHLERKMRNHRAMLNTLQAGIERAKAQSMHFGVTHENVVANLADLYSETISQLQPRIIVSGEHGFLSMPQNANKVRALLLGAMRSAVLWRQKGGNRLQLIFGRGKAMKMSKALLRET